MANTKISQLTELNTTPANSDELAIVDSGTTKRISVSNLMGAVPASSVEGTAILSTGESGGTKFLREDGDNSCSWQTVPAAPVTSVVGRTGTVTLSNTDVSGLGTAATQDVGISNGNVVQLDSTGLPAVDGSQLTNLPSPAVDGTAVTSTGQTGATKFLREDGDGTCSFQNVVVGDAELRGTANPHIGAFSNQSLKVLDSQPSGSAFMVANDSSLKFLVGSSANVFVVKGTSTASRLAEASELPSFIISKDSGEPDIELTDSDGEVYSIVNGDSDTVGANGLPVRQGYQIPNIGANPSPLLISGGTIS